MKRFLAILFTVFIYFIHTPYSFSQFKLHFGDISQEELSEKPYSPDPGADAVILSDLATASLNYSNGFYIMIERDVRIKIVNNDGFDYANIEIPMWRDDRMINYRASTFNNRNGEKIETKILKKNFIFENTSNYRTTLKFNFPDVHEGSVVEYSYIEKIEGGVYDLYPWDFQAEIPTKLSSLAMSYPEGFSYKINVSGSANNVKTNSTINQTTFAGESVKIITRIWQAENVPAFHEEPFILGKSELLTSLSFELANVDFPGVPFQEITPSYENLSKKLLERDDFGKVMKTDFRKLTEILLKGDTNTFDKIKKIHSYISGTVQWNGDNDYTASSTLWKILKKKRGTSADINLMLVAMLRSAYIAADPVVLSTRSHGTINEFSAVMNQFNYVLAGITLGNDYYLVDATDPLRPFYILPFECLNGKGRYINNYGSRFISLKNNEIKGYSQTLDLKLDAEGNISGTVQKAYSDFSACNIRKMIKLMSEDGYFDKLKSDYPEITFKDLKINNEADPYANCILRGNILIKSYAQIAGDEILINPFRIFQNFENPFSSPHREFPVNFGCPESITYSITFQIPDGYSIINKPADSSVELGTNDGKFEIQCSETSDHKIQITSKFSMNKTIYPTDQYPLLRDFYSKVLNKQSELIELKKVL